MQVERWLELAELEQLTTLHLFNHAREIGYGDAPLQRIHDAFTDFLATANDDGTPAGVLLKIFVETQAGAPILDCRYPDPPIDAEDRLVFLRAAGSDDELLERLGFNAPLLRRVEERIAMLLQRGVDEDIERAMQSALDALRPTLTTRPSGGVPPRYLPGRTYRPAVAVTRATTPWWFTYEHAVLEEERTLPNRASPLERSGYVAGMRARLGLRHASDSTSDADMAKHGGVRFRIFYQLTVSVPDALKNEVRQPAMFSDGYPDLFVTNERRPDGGRTVRLKDLTCAHLDCRCIDDGLPEGVMRQNAVLDSSCDVQIRGIYLVLHHDLARFQPPTCAEIRAMRSAA